MTASGLTSATEHQEPSTQYKQQSGDRYTSNSGTSDWQLTKDVGDCYLRDLAVIDGDLAILWIHGRAVSSTVLRFLHGTLSAGVDAFDLGLVAVGFRQRDYAVVGQLHSPRLIAHVVNACDLGLEQTFSTVLRALTGDLLDDLEVARVEGVGDCD